MTDRQIQSTAYDNCLQTALKHYVDVAWLGTHSPLAQPYFLGMSSNAVANPTQNGRALQNAIAQAWDILWDDVLPNNEKALLAQFHKLNEVGDKNNKYFALLLEFHYLHRVTRRSSSVFKIWDSLGISGAQYHRDRAQAIRILGENLLRHVHPHLQLERPGIPVGLYGRQTDIDNLHSVLNSHKSVNLFGISGVGKTSLSAAICQRWPEGSFFWYTLRPHLNDRLDNFLFALAFFLHQHGTSDLWRQILADNGQIKNSEMAVNLARHAIQQITPTPLLVIDDVDLLQPATFDAQNEEYARFLYFLESLNGSAILMFVGQRPVRVDSQQIELKGIDISALLEWFHAYKIATTTDEIHGLLNYTAGTPRLLTLCMALIQNGMPLRDVTEQLKSSRGIGPLMNRLISQMEDSERQVLAELAVFRQSAPVDAWQDRQPVLKSLFERGLIQLDLAGGASLLPIWGDLVLNELPPEAKAAFHASAAQVRSDRGEYTEAAYHYWQAGYPEAAIQIWYIHSESAIAFGEAAKASAIFNAIPSHRLSKLDQSTLALIRAKLAHFNGEYEKGLRYLGNINWPPSYSSSIAHELRGMLLTALGDNFGALHEYQAGLNDLAMLTKQQVKLFGGRSARFREEADYSKAWKELKHAKYLVEEFQGNLFDRQGRYVEAKESYMHALDLAKELANTTYIAQIHTSLGGIAVLGNSDPEDGRFHLNLALEIFEKTGNQFGVERVKNNMVVILMQSGRYQEALPLAQSLVDSALSMRHRSNTADASVNLSEIFFCLGDFDKAVHWAEVSLAQEQTASIPYAIYILGLVDNARKNFPHAQNCFQTILNDQTAEPYIIACAWRGLGEMHQLQDQTESATEAFGEAIALFKQMDMPNEVEKTQANLL